MKTKEELKAEIDTITANANLEIGRRLGMIEIINMLEHTPDTAKPITKTK